MSQQRSLVAVCQVCQKSKHHKELMPAELVRESLVAAIQRDMGHWDAGGFICLDDLNRLRAAHVQDVLGVERSELSELEQRVLESLHAHEILAADLNRQFDQTQSFGERIADRVADFGGSWTFIIGFGVVLVLWMGINTLMLRGKAFDPFPFIFLNLVLSCLAAVQAPIIMMSQNRQESKDRLRGEYDYKVNLKAELEIRNLTLKMDQLISHQWQHLLEIQQIQTDMMNEMLRVSGKGR